MKPLTYSLFLVLYLATTLSVSGQAIRNSHKAVDVSSLARTTTYVQLLEDDEYNAAIVEALEDWSLTKAVVFVEAGEQLGDPTDPTHSFLSFYEIVSGPERYTSLGLWQGGPAWTETLEAGEQNKSNLLLRSLFASWSLDSRGMEYSAERVAWRIPLIFGSFPQMIHAAQDFDDDWVRAPEIAEPLKSRLKSKTLLVPNSYFDQKNNQILKDSYHHDLQFVGFDVIQRAIRERDDRYAILCRISNWTPSLVIYDAATYEMLFALVNPSLGRLMRPLHLKQLGKQVGKK
ncbi:MAG: hypothetical protein JNL43_10185 [Flavobacteriales bacterium]|nr:hypothetical protein [Flavobacteriales bacterium]